MFVKYGIIVRSTLKNTKDCSSFDWKKAFEDLSVDEKVNLLMKHYSTFSEGAILIKNLNLVINKLSG